MILRTAIALLCSLLFWQESALAQWAAVSPPEREALIAIFEATDGPHWRRHEGWLSAPGSECKWFGVFCDADLHVVGLDLSLNDLRGSIPPEATRLVWLETVWLASNDLSSVPERWLVLSDDGRLNLNLNGNPLRGWIVKVSVERSAGSMLCSHSFAEVRESQTMKVALRCRHRTPADREEYCQLRISDGRGLHNLGRMLDRIGIEQLRADYSDDSSGHGEFGVLRVTRDGLTREVNWYGSRVPIQLVMATSVISAEFDDTWGYVVASKPAAFCRAVFDQKLTAYAGNTFLIEMPASLEALTERDVVEPEHGGAVVVTYTIRAQTRTILSIVETLGASPSKNTWPGRIGRRMLNGMPASELLVRPTEKGAGRSVVVQTKNSSLTLSYEGLMAAEAAIADGIIASISEADRP